MTQEMRSACNTLQRLTVDLGRSRGSVIVTREGKELLDMNSNIASLPLGYNHPDLSALSRNPSFQRLSLHRQALNFYPPLEHEIHLHNLYPRFSPIEDAYVHLSSSGSEAVESVIKYASRALLRRIKTPNQGPLVASLSGGFHGRTTGALSLTRTDPIYNHRFSCIPNLGLPFPRSPTDEEDCLKEIDRRLFSAKNLSAVFVEPVQCEGGDTMASGSFYRSLRKMCTRRNIPFVVDEVQTCLGTGRIWAHAHWGLKDPPDAVIFSKKTQVSGAFLGKRLAPLPSEAISYNSTWAGDAMRGGILSCILDVIERDDLLDTSFRLGTKFFADLKAIDGIAATRNVGFFGSFDVEYRDSIVSMLQDSGLIVAPSGNRSIRIRPSLVVSQLDSSKALQIIDSVLRDCNKLYNK